MTLFNLATTIQSTAPSGQPVNFRYPETRAINHVVGNTLTLTPLITGGTGPFAFSTLSGSLPTGLSLASNGVISGTLTTIGDFSAIIQIQDSLGVQYPAVFAFSVYSGYRVVRGTPTTGARGTAYSYQFVFADAAGVTTGFTFSVLSGSMPGGLSLSSGGLITGTPTAPAVGTTWLTVRGTKAGINLDIPVSITITSAISLTLLNPVGMVNQPFEAKVVVADAVYPVTFAVTANSLPDGLALNTLNGKITGTPTAFTPSSGALNPTITVTDAVGQTTGIAVPFQINQGTKAIPKGMFAIGAADETTTPVDFWALRFGSGNDGNFVLNGTNTYPGIFLKSGNNYTAQRHINAANIQIVSPGVLVESSIEIDVSDTFDMSGCPAGSYVADTGLAASGATAGNAISALELGGTQQGSNGATGTTTGVPSVPATPTTTVNAVPGNAYAGGNGGSGPAGAGSVGGAAGAISGTLKGYARQNPYDPMSTPAGGALNGGAPGGAGGAGRGTTGSTGGNGGGAGAGGGVGRLRCRRFKTDGSTAAGAISFKGGNAGNGTNATGTNAGGGGGGSGGVGGRFSLTFLERIGSPVTNLIDVSGGDGGLKGTKLGTGTDGTDGTGGDSGVVEVHNLLTGTVLFQGVVVNTLATRAGAVNRMTV